MSDFQPGEIVDITIKGARITNVYPRTDLDRLTVPILVADYTDGVERSVAVSLAADSVTVERVAPAEWPPQPGDIWGGPKNERWFAAMYLGDPDVPKDWEGCNSEGWRVVLIPLEVGPYGDSDERPDDALRTRGPLTLVHREGPKAEYCTSDGCGHHKQLHHGNQCVGGNAHDDPCRCTHFQVANCDPDEPAEDNAPAKYPEPGSEIPDHPGYVVGKCGHRVAGSEWRAGFKTCERCPGEGGGES